MLHFFSGVHSLQKRFSVSHLLGLAMAGQETALPRAQRLRRVGGGRGRSFALLLHLVHVQDREPGQRRVQVGLPPVGVSHGPTLHPGPVRGSRS